jgi:hypothetical protein
MRTFSLIWSGIGCFATVAITVLGGIILTNGKNTNAAYYGDAYFLVYIHSSNSLYDYIESYQGVEIFQGLSSPNENYLIAYGSLPFHVEITLKDKYVVWDLLYSCDLEITINLRTISITTIGEPSRNNYVSGIVFDGMKDMTFFGSLEIRPKTGAVIIPSITGPESNVKTRKMQCRVGDSATTLPPYTYNGTSNSIRFNPGEGHYVESITLKNAKDSAEFVKFFEPEYTVTDQERGTGYYIYKMTSSPEHSNIWAVCNSSFTLETTTIILLNVTGDIAINAVTKIFPIITSHISMEE